MARVQSFIHPQYHMTLSNFSYSLSSPPSPLCHQAYHWTTSSLNPISSYNHHSPSSPSSATTTSVGHHHLPPLSSPPHFYIPSSLISFNLHVSIATTPLQHRPSNCSLTSFCSFSFTNHLHHIVPSNWNTFCWNSFSLWFHSTSLAIIREFHIFLIFHRYIALECIRIV